jgi:Tfp pilus assembly protein PilF
MLLLSRHRIASVLTSALVAACASAPPAAPPVPPERWFADTLFAPPSVAIDDDIFAPSDAMRKFVERTIAPAARTRGPRDALLDAVGKQAGLKIDYDTAQTRNAAQAFEARAGNCLSLVVMTTAFADMLGVPVRFNSVLVDESWSRADNVYFASGHVNLTLARGAFGERSGYDAARETTIDFVPPRELRGLRTRTISRESVMAMYLNNRAAEALAAQQLDNAYWWARRAIERVPSALTSYNTLAVIYLRRGAVVEAERLLRHVHRLEPGNTKVLFNLAQVLERVGRHDEASPLREQLARLESVPPFHYFDQGLAAMARGEYARARVLFTQELERSSEYHEFHFGIAVASYYLGDLKASRAHLDKAIELTPTKKERELYAAKAQRLGQLMQ